MRVKILLVLAFLAPLTVFGQTFPTTNIVGHLAADTNAQLYTDGDFGTNITADNAAVPYWRDVTNSFAAGTLSSDPLWRHLTPTMLNPNLDFNGSANAYQLYRDDTTCCTVTKSLANPGGLVTASGGEMAFVFYMEGCGTNNANGYDNDSLFADAGGNWVVYCRNNSGTYSIGFYHYDGADKMVEKTVNINTTYVLMLRHDTGTIYISIDGGTETSLADGNLTQTGQNTYLGRNWNNAHFFNGRIGEFAVWSAPLTTMERSDAITVLKNKWEASAPVCNGGRGLTLGVGGC